MERIAFDTLRGYFKDRVKELKNQLPNGDPFVIVGVYTVLSALGSASSHIHTATLIRAALSDVGSDASELIYRSLLSMGSRLVANDFQRAAKVEFSHKEPTKVELLRIVVNVHDLVNGLDSVVDEIFSDRLLPTTQKQIEDHFNTPGNIPIGLVSS